MGNCNCNNTPAPGGICIECDIPQFARNNYFTGKLLVERDFTDEQRYFLGKLRHHNQTLHGWGAVCGLKVEQHPNPACQAQYVVIEPGTAVDCCGREIVVRHQETFDFAQQFLTEWQVQNGSGSQPDSNGRTIQICVSYTECATESVPSVFDDCSHSGAACQPNRIVDGYKFDVIIDPKEKGNNFPGVSLDWGCTINTSSAVRVALDNTNQIVYVLANPSSGAVLYSVAAGSGSITDSISFANQAALDVALSPAGDFVYIALQPSAAGSDPQISVIKSDFSATISTLTVTGGAGQPVRLAVAPAPDDRLLAVNPSAGAFIWATDVTTSSTPAAPTQIAVGASPMDACVGASGKYAYVVNSGSGNVTAVTLSNLAVSAVAVGTGSAVPVAAAVASTSAGDTLAVLDKNQILYVIGIRPDPASAAALGSPVTGFANPALGLAIAGAGQWIYLVEKDASGKGWVQPVNEYAVETNQPTILGSPIPAGIAPSGEIVISADGTRLYMPYSGNTTGVPGAVAIINVRDSDCSAIFDCALQNCPDCSTGNCIVLATIKGYVYQKSVTDSMIDNLTDRRLLVSTDLITEAVKCLMTQSSGSGTQGPPGPPGQPGQNGSNGTNGVGLEAGLTRISALSWIHAANYQPITLTGIEGGELVLAMEFSNALDITQIDPVNVFQVWTYNERTALSTVQMQWVQLVGHVYPATIAPGDIDTTTGRIKSATKASTEPANGVVWVLNKVDLPFNQVRICFLGDFVVDGSGHAVSSEFVRAQLPTGAISAGSSYSLEGGTFESWFAYQQ